MNLIVQVNSILTDVHDLRGPWTCNTASTVLDRGALARHGAREALPLEQRLVICRPDRLYMPILARLACGCGTV